MAKPVVARVTKDTSTHLKGAEFGFASESDARKVLGEGNYKIVGHVDGSPYEAPKKDAPKKDAD